MTTLATMKDRINRETRNRVSSGAFVEDAIRTAIGRYDGERFWFNDGRETSFSTVASQEFYTESADIGVTIWKIDYVVFYIDDQPYYLRVETPERMEILSMNGTETGEPRYYCWYGSKLRIYPVPADVYTVRIGGVIGVAAPTTDNETGNAWMVQAEYLIRQRAKWELATSVMVDAEIAQAAAEAVQVEFDRLKARTANRTQSGGWVMTPTQF